MPVHRTRRLRRSFQDPKWTSKIRSAIFPSFLDNTAVISPAIGGALDSFYKYVEDQRYSRSIQGSRSLKDTATEVLLQNLIDLDNLDDVPKHIARCLWHTLNKRYVNSRIYPENSGHQAAINLLNI
jgi:hypothetical protein